MSAERRMGELLIEMEATREKAKRGGDPKSRPGILANLKTLGISLKEGARAKRLAEPSEEVFEQALADAKELGQLTHATVIKHATKREAQCKRVRGSWPFRGNWTDLQIEEASAWFDGLPDCSPRWRRRAMKATGKGHHGGAGRGFPKSTLAPLGITKDEGARAKRLAEPSPEVFEQALADAKKLGQLTHAAVIKHATNAGCLQNSPQNAQNRP